MLRCRSGGYPHCDRGPSYLSNRRGVPHTCHSDTASGALFAAFWLAAWFPCGAADFAHVRAEGPGDGLVPVAGGVLVDQGRMDRILDVRKALQPWAEQDCVQALDDQLYGWQATLSSLQR
jgi:hypothetical protein